MPCKHGEHLQAWYLCSDAWGMSDAKLLGPDVDDLPYSHKLTARARAGIVEDHGYSRLVEELSCRQCSV